jgi:hypothetical protein
MLMLQRLSDRLQGFSTGKATFIALVIFALFNTFVLPGQAAAAQEISAGAGTPDLSFYYSADDLYAMAESYGEQGRSAYIRARFTFDVIWPLIFTFLLVTSISWLSKRIFSKDSRWQMANIVPIFGASFDYLENISNAIVMALYPESSAFFANFAGFATSLKWIFVGTSIVLMIGFVLFAFWKHFFNRG